MQTSSPPQSAQLVPEFLCNSQERALQEFKPSIHKITPQTPNRPLSCFPLSGHVLINGRLLARLEFAWARASGRGPATKVQDEQMTFWPRFCSSETSWYCEVLEDLAIGRDIM